MRISVWSGVTVYGTFYFVAGILALPSFLFVPTGPPGSENQIAWFGLVVPLAFGAWGCFGGGIVALAYNAIARYVGGLVLEAESTPVSIEHLAEGESDV